MLKRFAVGAVTTVAVLAAIWGYGHYQYRQGVAAEKLRAQLIQVDIERGLQYERDRADAEYRGAILARENAQRDLDTVQLELSRVLQDLRSTEIAGASGRLNAASAGRLAGFAACVAEYGILAKDAARWADQVNGLQGYVRSIHK